MASTASTIRLEVVTPDRMVLSEDVDIAVATGTEGEFGVLHQHIPFLATLAEGELRYRLGGAVHYLAVNGGLAQVLSDKITILAESAELAREIDVNRALHARERAEKRLAEAKREELEHTRAEAALKRAMIRIKVAAKASGAPTTGGLDH
ncbi:MAG: F0F1 ATP synthase subunit epsilon [Thermodesulfobacteriota bacterium]